ncbi:phage tail protein [Paenibacillus sp. L3-i20]|uniref:phage tail protein n=1 Tax=Paenibacillus sp. L3-i20 TaxID=2905833 RepID=UPI001EDE2421|nr:tail fiber protein [Paenibacillus sp. L3-i20]
MEPFVGEIRLFSFGIIPRGWAPCNGQLLPINNNQVLFSIIGVTFGGDGRNTFALPNLQGRAPVAPGNTVAYGASIGEANTTLTQTQIPNHSHIVNATNNTANSNKPGDKIWASSPDQSYSSNMDKTMSTSSISTSGSSQPHNNIQPSIVVSYCISLTGIYPSRQ